jgi:murein DD-endopeptidase MepM/ murein hydrolase activator NlpD
VGRGRLLRDFADFATGAYRARRNGRDIGGDRQRDERSKRYPASDESAEYSATRDSGASRQYGARYDQTGYSEALPAYGETGYSEALPAYGETGYSDALSAYDRALAPIDGDSALLPSLVTGESGPFVIPGTGESMNGPLGGPFGPRRARPLTMRIAIVTLATCILVTGLFAVTPLGSSAASGLSSFQALSGAVIVRQNAGFFWYLAQWGDTTTSVAAKFHVQEGGIYELNGLYAEQDFTVGKWYKIPTDPNYGAGFVPKSLASTLGGGSARFGNSPWTSIAGTCPAETVGGPKGSPSNPLSYKLQPPNPGAVWVRGFSWFHNGVDLAAPDGNPIHAAQTGQVIWAGWDVGGLGNSVKIDHCNGLATVYGHMMRFIVTAGQRVNAGDVIGYEGSTGWSTGPHCHYMVEVSNNPVDPMAYYGYSEYAITLNPSYK